jgi:hypothetical protein
LVLARVQVSNFSGSDFGVGGLVACCCFSAFGLTCWPVELQWLVFGGVLLCYFIGYCCCCYCFLNGYVLVVVAPV